MHVCVLNVTYHISNGHNNLSWKSVQRAELHQGTCICSVFGWGAWNKTSRLISRFGCTRYCSKARDSGQRAKWNDWVIIFNLRRSTLQLQSRISQVFFYSLLKEGRANITENIIKIYSNSFSMFTHEGYIMAQEFMAFGPSVCS